MRVAVIIFRYSQIAPLKESFAQPDLCRAFIKSTNTVRNDFFEPDFRVVNCNDAPIVLDMATTNAAAGKIKVLAQRGEQMPEGWMVDREGNPLTDPTRQSEGLLLPIGGPKGYGLAMAIGLLGGTLNGAAFGRDVVNFTKETATPTNTGQFVAAISVESFGDLDTFKSTVDNIFTSFRESDAYPGGNPVRIPGQDRGDTRREREENGIPLHPNLVKVLGDIADELGISKLAGA